MKTAFDAAQADYPNNEEMRHCYASCLVARRCSAPIAAAAGFGFEALTAALDEIDGEIDWNNHFKDMISNAQGIFCAMSIMRWVPCKCCCELATGN